MMVKLSEHLEQIVTLVADGYGDHEILVDQRLGLVTGITEIITAPEPVKEVYFVAEPRER